ncbi:MAG TPA: hypothetical protein PLV25_01345 [Opitutales bacterium]|nr:hypothetical protein [Opitutales bacterium]
MRYSLKRCTLSALLRSLLFLLITLGVYAQPELSPDTLRAYLEEHYSSPEPTPGGPQLTVAFAVPIMNHFAAQGYTITRQSYDRITAELLARRMHAFGMRIVGVDEQNVAAHFLEVARAHNAAARPHQVAERTQLLAQLRTHQLHIAEIIPAVGYIMAWADADAVALIMDCLTLYGCFPPQGLRDLMGQYWLQYRAAVDLNPEETPQYIARRIMRDFIEELDVEIRQARISAARAAHSARITADFESLKADIRAFFVFSPYVMTWPLAQRQEQIIGFLRQVRNRTVSPEHVPLIREFIETYRAEAVPGGLGMPLCSLSFGPAGFSE